MSSKNAVKVFIGYDPAEIAAYEVAEKTLLKYASCPVSITPLNLVNLRSAGLLWRLVDTREGRAYDLTSNAPQATEFAVSRFLVPLLAQSGSALFVDCDMVFQEDVRVLFEELFDPTYAVQVVKHQHDPTRSVKMINKPQTRYHRKNWSSVMLFNCDHPGNRRLSVNTVNTVPGRDLHSFFWLSDVEIGELPQGWNWLVDEQPKPDKVCIAHYTNGGPWFSEWTPRESDDLWLKEKNA